MDGVWEPEGEAGHVQPQVQPLRRDCRPVACRRRRRLAAGRGAGQGGLHAGELAKAEHGGVDVDEDPEDPENARDLKQDVRAEWRPCKIDRRAAGDWRAAVPRCGCGSRIVWTWQSLSASTGKRRGAM